MRLGFARVLWAAWVLAVVLHSPVNAVIISTASDVPNVKAPGNDPGWNHVGRIAGGSGVYLGNRWVLTANHVSPGSFRLSDGRTFLVSVGSELRLHNTGTAAAPGNPDLRMFRLATDPGLPALTIADSPPAVNQQVTMIGAGANRAADLKGWQTAVVGNGLQWTPAPVLAANQFGYELLPSSTMRWGVNLVASQVALSTEQTWSFTTRFDQQGVPFEAQATHGDSGGGVFVHTEGAWELVGLMTSTQLLSNQPANTVMFGNQTVIADLSRYREEILGLTNRAEPLWQNQVNHFDVSGTGAVTPRDALLLINQLLANGPRALTGAPGAGESFLDVNGDYNLTPADALAVINRLLAGNAAAASVAPSGSVNFVPEPANIVLGGWALAAALAVIYRHRRRRSRVSPRGTPGTPSAR